MSGSYHHRSGKLHQSNKVHKTSGGFSTKRSVSDAAHGRVEKVGGGAGGGGSIAGSAKHSVKSLSSLSTASKANRLNHAKQVKEQRKAEALVAKRLGSAGGGYGAPKVAAIVGLGATANRAAVAASLLALADDAVLPGGGEAFGSPLTLTYHTFRSRLTLLVPPREGEVSPPVTAPGASHPTVYHYDVTHTLAGCQAADVLIAVVDMAAAAAAGGSFSGSNADWEASVDASGDLLMSCVKALGLPTVIGVIQGLDRLPASRQADARRWANRLFTTEFGQDVKVVEAADCLTSSPVLATKAGNSSSSSKAGLAAAVADGSSLHLVRAVCSVSPKQLTWRSHRPYMLIQGMQFTPTASSSNSSDRSSESNGSSTASGPTGSLTLTGYLRGVPLNVHQLVHLPWAGAYQIESIAKPAALGGGGNASGGDPFKPPHASGAKNAKKVFDPSVSGAAAAASGSTAVVSSSNNRVYRPLAECLAPVTTIVSSNGAAVAPGTAAVRLIAPTPSVSSSNSASSSSGAAVAASSNTTTSSSSIGSGGGWEVLAHPDPAYQEPLDTVAQPEGGGDEDDMAGGGNEQTWPEEDEDEDEDDEDDNSDSEMASGGKQQRKGGGKKPGHRLGPGPSGWLSSQAQQELDMQEGDDEDEEDGGSEEDDAAKDAAGNWSRPLPEDASTAAARKAAALAEAVEGRSKLKGRARRQALKRRGVELPDEEEDEDDDEENAGDNDGDDDAMSLGAGDDAGVTSQAAADAARAAMRGDGNDAAAAGRTPLQLAAETNAQFPDEIDTPVGAPARERFGRYRGLKSFRSSPWDPQESLPPSYGHIFHLPHFARLQRRTLGEAALAERALLTLEGQALTSVREGQKAARAAAKERAAEQRKGASGASNSTSSSSSSSAVEPLDEEMDGDDGDAAADVSVGAGGGGGGGDEEMMLTTSGGGKASSSASAAASTAAAYRSLSDVLGPGWVSSGQLVAITLKDVPASVVAEAVLPGVPLTATALLRHENRTSVMHYSLQRYAPYEDDAPLKGKTHLELHCGIPGRVTDIRPLFSTASSSAAAERAKLERFCPGGGTWTTATAFAPVTYAPMPALFFRRIPLTADAVDPAEAEGGAVVTSEGDVPGPHPALYTARPGALDQRSACGVTSDPAVIPSGSVPAPRYRLQLVGWGSCAGANPDRIVLKRTILSGFPVKVKNRSAVVKYMFFDPSDVAWFAPVELYTKHGCVGSVKESVGTHGLFKARFDRVIKQHDTVCMPLYKRVYPRWGHGYAGAGLIRKTAEEEAMEAFARGPKTGARGSRK